MKGGGHSYQGTSNAADSLLIWTRGMNAVTLHDAFVGAGCAGQHPPQPAVTVEAGAIWGRVYDAVTTKAGRYVQGGGCLTVGVAGLIQSGGFGSFSKAYGMAAASLLEAEIVTADGAVRIANACTNPDLFWGIKGGGGGSLGVVTRLTLRTHDLPEFFGAVFTTIKATSDAAFRRLIGQVVSFYSEKLLNPHWGEQIAFRPGNVLAIAMVFQGLDQQQAEAIWRPFFDWLAASPQDFSIVEPGRWIMAAPARHFWDPGFLKKLPGIVLADDRPGAPEANVFWAGNLEEAGQVLHGYQSAWLPASLLQKERQEESRRCAVRGEPALGRVAACQQGPCRRACRSDRRGQGHGDEPGGSRCLRADHQRGRGAAGLSRHSRSRARPVDCAQTCGGDRRSDGRGAQAAARMSAPTSRRAISSTRRGANPSGDRTTQGCSRLRTNTIPTASSSCITAWAANAGAPTASQDWPELGRDERDKPRVPISLRQRRFARKPPVFACLPPRLVFTKNCAGCPASTGSFVV